MKAFYNEIDKYAAQWLRNLSQAGEITPGHIEEKTIEALKAKDLKGYARAHFFAGIAGWDLALKIAGWPREREVWTGSCPCQPFSDAGLRKGEKDPRHLWPQFKRLIGEAKPPVVFGEQVASAAGRVWLDGVQADLEDLGYEVGASDLCSAGVGAPHIRQRLWWVAYAQGERRHRVQGAAGPHGRPGLETGGTLGRVADSEQERRGGQSDGPRGNDLDREEAKRKEGSDRAKQRSGLGNAGCAGLQIPQQENLQGAGRGRQRGAAQQSGSSSGPWGDFYTVKCSDGKSRRIGTGIKPLAYGVPGRVGRLRAYGNAINPWAAAEFIRTVMEYLEVVACGTPT